MAQAFLVGRVLLGGYYLFSAYTTSLTSAGWRMGRRCMGCPRPRLAVVGAGMLLAVAGVTLLLGVFPRLGIGALVLFFVPVTVMMHPFWADTTAATRQANIINFTKNVGLLGSSLMFLAIPRPWPYSLERPPASQDASTSRSEERREEGLGPRASGLGLQTQTSDSESQASGLSQASGSISGLRLLTQTSDVRRPRNPFRSPSPEARRRRGPSLLSPLSTY